MSNPKPVEGVLDGTHNPIVSKCAQRIEEYLRPSTFNVNTFDCTVYSIVQDALKEAALSAAAPRCNRCAADLCEHDNCTDWTCARACSKCAPGPAPARDGVRELRAAGWMVAVHNDYRQDGKTRTFWLMVKGERALKGEGDTDDEAIAQILALAAKEQADGQERR